MSQIWTIGEPLLVVAAVAAGCHAVRALASEGRHTIYSVLTDWRSLVKDAKKLKRPERKRKRTKELRKASATNKEKRGSSKSVARRRKPHKAAAGSKP